jgi:hypothetical protein
MATPICCPIPTYLASAVTSTTGCAQDVGQIQKFIFWRRDNNTTVASAITSTYWSTALTATGDTKAVVSPFCGNVEVEPGDAREFGGGNETRDGIPIIKGSEATTLMGRFYQEDQDVIETMKDWKCEKLDVIMINENNQLIYDDRGGATVYGFPLESLNIKDLRIGGYTDADYNEFSMRLVPNWSDGLEISAATTFALGLVNS